MEAGALMSYATAAAIERVASLKQDYQQRIAVRPPPTRSSFLQREDLISNCLGQGIDGLIRSDGGARTLSGRPIGRGGLRAEQVVLCLWREEIGLLGASQGLRANQLLR
jgi:hypothetical protein